MINYKTEIYNNTDATLHLTLDWFGKRRATFAKNSWGYVISTWFMSFAPFSKVIYEANGDVRLKKRLKFRRQFKKEDYTLKLLNLHDRIDNYKIGSLYHGSFSCPRGIPIIVVTHPLDRLSEWKEIKILPDFVKEKIVYGMVPTTAMGNKAGAVERDERRFERSPNLEYKPRSKAELEKLSKLRKELLAKDPDQHEYYDMLSLYNRQRWGISDDDLREEGDLTTAEFDKQRFERQQREAEEFEIMR